MRYLKKPLVILLITTMIIQGTQMTKAEPVRDYLQITLADIIISWFNATGTAIGYTDIVNDLYTSYGINNLGNMVDVGIIKSNTTNDKEEIKQLIGYGNLTAPTVYCDVGALRTWMSRHPVTQKTSDAMKAMFASLGGDANGYQGLACAIGEVANLGKIPYNQSSDIGTNVTNENFVTQNSLKQVLQNFTGSQYFINLVNETGTGEEEDYLNPYSLEYPNRLNEGYRLGGIKRYDTEIQYYGYYPRNVVHIVYKSGSRHNQACVNLNNESKIYYQSSSTAGIFDNVIRNNLYSNANLNIDANSLGGRYTNLTYIGTPIGMAIKVPDNITDIEEIIEYVRENNPWEESTSGGTGGATEYINAKVGNITKDNMVDLSTNINMNDYMYIFNRTSYEVVIGEITQNTNNGTITNNGDIITNYNNTYIQKDNTPDVRPSTAPAPSEQPAQPFISPRPTVAPEAYESVIHDGAVPESIKNKFPFCIPWDIKALVDGLWSPTRKAPYIHWDATFGSWGKLGEIDIDLSEFDTVAQIHRSIILLLWILGLVVITKNLLS